MDSIALILFWIFVLAIVMLSIPMSCNKKTTEGFDMYPYYSRRYCPSCEFRGRGSCSMCLNCGYCIKADGTGRCLPGDSNGPYFAEDCAYWTYGQDNEFYYPYSNIYPVVKIKSMFPHYDFKLSKPWKTLRPRSHERN